MLRTVSPPLNGLSFQYHTADNSLYLPPNHPYHSAHAAPSEEGFNAIHEHLNSILQHLMLIDRKYDRLEVELFNISFELL